MSGKPVFLVDQEIREELQRALDRQKAVRAKWSKEDPRAAAVASTKQAPQPPLLNGRPGSPP